MEIYDISKKILLDKNKLDLNLGYLKNDVIIVHHNEVKGVDEKGHFETIVEYSNGGKDVKWVVDEPGITPVDEYDEEKEILVYIEYTKKELNERKIFDLKEKLNESDYKAIKYFEGYYTEKEYQPIKKYREDLREQIRILENEIGE